ncbi:MAG TPA: SCO family protein [Candidatus Tumulicola sp.]|jgi:cytochrome oxidase Cu insertion factor (SCO1/SenC/PrrC family)
MIAIVIALLSILPVHGIVVQHAGVDRAMVRTDTVQGTLPGGIRLVRIAGGAGRLPVDTGFDAMLDRSTVPWTLTGAVPAGPFAPGMPQPGRVLPVQLGTGLPRAVLVDQNARPVQLQSEFVGRTTLLSFVFTRCPDRTLCPAISGKFAYLQAHLDPKKFALVEITLDPPYDSPEVLRRYGASYGANPAMWTLLTGTGSTVARLLDEFEVPSLRVSPDNYLHGDKLFIVTPQGRVGSIVETAAWDPRAALAEARDIAGMGSNPFERFKLSLVANVVAFCGGSQFAGIVMLELMLFALIVAIVAAGLWWVARVLWAK